MKKYYIERITTKEENGIQSEGKKLESGMKKLEEALEFCRFGRFHIRLLLASLTGFMSASVTTSTSSFILTSAECDLNLNNVDKGMIIAAPFLGQVLISLISGIMADALGRKPCLVFGYLAMCVCCILEGSSQTVLMLLFAKLVAGMALSFTFNGVTTMLAEMTHKGMRDRVMLIGMALSPFTQIMVTLLAWGVLPQSWSLVVWKKYFVIHSWNIYLYICAIFSLLSALQYFYLPESPKYLLAHGNHDKALQNLKKIYSENTGHSSESFPIKSLIEQPDNIKKEKLSLKEHFAGASSCFKELFRRPLVGPLILICTVYFVSLLAMSTLRLWYPQLSTIIEGYYREHNDTTYFCTMIDSYFKNRVSNITLHGSFDAEEKACVPIISGPETYYNSIFIYLMPLFMLMVSVVLVNYIGQKFLALANMVLSSVTLLALFWSTTPMQIASVIAISNGFNNSQFHLLSSIGLRTFPTTSRSLAMSLASLMSGRIGSLAGNVLLPVMLDFGCAVPFGSLSLGLMLSAVLICFLPNPSKDNKETGDG